MPQDSYYNSLWIIILIIILFGWGGNGCGNNCGCNNCGCNNCGWCYPGMEEGLNGAQPQMARGVVVDGKVITGRAAGSAF